MDRRNKQPLHAAKSIAYGALHYFKKKRQERVIRRFDGAAPLRSPGALKTLAAAGWAVSSSRQMFGTSLASLLGTTDCMPLPSTDVMGNALSRSVPSDLLRAILASDLLRQTAQAYLGPGARLDDLYLWKKDFAQQQRFDISEGWHTDNVGHRLKMFVGIHASEGAPATLLVEGSHARTYTVGMGEFMRFLGRIRKISPSQRVAEIRYAPDTIGVFDTNALHRGQYQQSSAQRTCLVLEFIDREKGNRLSGVCPCGPGQSPDGRLELPLDLWNDLQRHPLIDPRLLRREANCASYSIANMTNNQNSPAHV